MYTKKSFTIIFLTLMFLFTNVSLYGSTKELLLADNGKTFYVILEGVNPSLAEKTAAKELKIHLEKVTGAKFLIQKENKLPYKGNAIYVGNTSFAQKNNIDVKKLHSEEWVIKNVGKNLILTGGNLRGTLYAVYEFLEQQVNCYWFDEYMEQIPVKKKLIIPALNIKNKPAFYGRQIAMGKPILRDSRQLIVLRARNKDTRNTCGAEFGFGEGVSSHSFYAFSKKFPADKKEYLAMYFDGTRPVAKNGSGPGQICLTNPGARQEVIKQIKANLTKFYKEKNKSIVPVVSLIPNDKNWCCQCPECKAVIKKENADSGALLSFVNFIAEEIKKDFPSALISTAAYMNNVTAPKFVRPNDNVMVEIAQLNAEWATSDVQKAEFPELFRPLLHPLNTQARKTFTTWANISKQLEVWDYWVEWTDKFPTPYVILNTIASDLKFFQKCKVGRVYVEQEYFRNNPCFHSLTTWVGWKLMQDPNKNLDQLVKIFMKGYYGPAGNKMYQLWQMMEQSIAAVPVKAGKMSVMRPTQRPYLTLDFYRKGQKLLDEAEKLCPVNSRYLLNVQKERIPFDAGLYCMWEQLQKQLPKGQKMYWKQSDILKRYETNRLNQIKKRWPSALKKSTKEIQQKVTFFKGLAAKRLGKQPPIIHVPYQKLGAKGKIANVNWTKAFYTDYWTTVTGVKQAACQIKAAFIRDADYLYIALEQHNVNPAKIKNIWWSGDIWELFFSSNRSGKPYKQLGLNAANEYHAFDYTNGTTGWKIAGFEHKSEIKNGLWKICVAMPLKAVMSSEDVKVGNGLFLNIFRHVTDSSVTMSLSPTYEANYHDMAFLAELRLDLPWPEDKDNLFKGKSYTLSVKPNYQRCVNKQTDLKKLTDGLFAPAKRPAWLEKKYTVGYSGAKPSFTVDMGAVKNVNMVYYHTGAGIAGVEPTPKIQVYASIDNKNFSLIGTSTNKSTFGAGYRPMTIAIPVKEVKARYIRVDISGSYFLFCDELAATGKNN